MKKDILQEDVQEVEEVITETEEVITVPEESPVELEEALDGVGEVEDTEETMPEALPEFEKVLPEFYKIIPEFNAKGRLCNYHTGPGETVQVPAEEWERFNLLAGRKHEIIDGFVVFNESLPTAYPDGVPTPFDLKLAELAKACENAIFAGVSIETSQGLEHFSLTINDQTNIGNLALQAQANMPVLYHADGKLCRTFTPEEMLKVATEATKFKTYHTTYCNHLNVWVRRTEDETALKDIVYGCQLPEDLAENMTKLLGGNSDENE